MSGLKVLRQVLLVGKFPSFETLYNTRRTFTNEIEHGSRLESVSVPLPSSSYLKSKG
jgi:hypothetical protein